MIIEFETHEKPFVRRLPIGVRKRGEYGHMRLFETQFRPNQLDGDDKGLSAPHVGLAQFTLCNGSVRAITQEIDAEIDNALGSLNGGEVIGSDGF
ncbi:DUF1559 domain-containing protein [Rhodopirellula bahusiensis]|uniref:DUF1559 family PulG-like putative transporter n=1 Tax=Rhodopirellula bahusiensis TaxID=2014065 RepID=UPI003267CDCB